MRKKPTVVCSAIIEKNNKVLLVFCPLFKLWRVPGGRTEWDETLEQTLIREMEEEVGTTFQDLIFVGWGQDHEIKKNDNEETSRLIMFFHVKTDQDLTIDPREAEDYKWVSWEEFKNHEGKEGALNDFLKRNPNYSI